MKRILHPVGYVLLLLFVIQPLLAQHTTYLEGEVEILANGFQFVEGPVWKDGVLLFSDIPANKIYKWTADEGASEFLSPSGNSNGLALDQDGNLILAQHGPRQISRLEEDGTLTPIATHYNGKRLNSPNDLTIKSDGSIYFTDPVFGLNDQDGTSELGFQGVYRISPEGKVQLLDSLIDLPNGIAFSPDESILYVNASQNRIIYAYDVIDDSTLANKRIFASIPQTGYADGMEMDEEGNLFCAGPQGVWVFDSTGTVLDTIVVDSSASNCAWGDEDGKTLYMTSRKSVYRVRPNLTGTSTLYNDKK